ncbi:pyridoxine 5'-phosphate synthase [bacterium]|nr:pyridoxine 5'-phosphate synthase [bacterium]
MTVLSVNVNKIALLRNAREGNYPDVVGFARLALETGAAGITVHPRPDGRHIREYDVRALRDLVTAFPGTELNVEGYPNDAFLNLITSLNPHQVTFVPDPPEALTSSFGWDVVTHQTLVCAAVNTAHEQGIRTSLFIDETFDQLDALVDTRTDRVELYTGPYALAYPDCDASLQHFTALAHTLTQHGIGINAGHDLNQDNLLVLLKAVPAIAEVSIGHALTVEALQEGWKATVESYLRLLK